MFTYILFLFSITLSQNCKDCVNDNEYEFSYYFNNVISGSNYTGIKLNIYSAKNNIFRIVIPHKNIDKTINISAGQLLEENINEYMSDNIYINNNFGQIEDIPLFLIRAFKNVNNNGVKIFSKFELIVNINYYRPVGSFNFIQHCIRHDASNISNSKQYGTKFRINSPRQWVYLFANLYSTCNNNIIKYKINDNIYNYEKEFVLNKGDNVTFDFNHTSDFENSGIEIESKYPLYLLQGARFTSFTNEVGKQSRTNTYYHTLYPNRYLGKEYILTPFDLNNSIIEYLYKVVPLEDNTEIIVNGINRGKFNKVNYIQEFTKDITHIIADKKISVSKYAVSTTNYSYLNTIQPTTFFIHEIPLKQKSKELDFIVSSPRGLMYCDDNYDIADYKDSMYCSIISEANDEVYLDGVLLNGFTNIPNSKYKYKSEYVTFGNHKVQSNEGVIATVYGHTYDYANFYGYNAGGAFNRDDADILVNDKSYNEFICGNSSFNLSADAPGEAVEFDWTINDTLKVSGKEVNLDLPNAGTYNIKLKLDNDGSQVYEWTTTRLEEIISDLDSVIYLCNDSLSNISMNVSGGGTSKSITWYPSENIKDPTQFNIEFIKPLKESTKLFYEVIDEHCCTYLDSVDILITNVYPIITTTQNNFCYGDSTTLSLDKDYETIIWNTGEITKDIIVKESGIYSATVTQGECINDTNIVIKVNPLPTLDIEAPNGTILCDGGSIILEAKVLANTRITWNDGTKLVKRTIFISGTYTLTAEDLKTGCKNTKSIVVSDIENLKAEIQGDPTFCDGESTTLTIQPQGKSYLWSNGETSQSIVVNESGVYSATITTDTDCKIDAEKEVNKNPIPTFQILGERIICNNSITIYPEKDFKFYQWSNGETSKSITIDKAGNYDLTVTDNNGCKATQSIEITESKPEINLSNRNIDFGELLFGDTKSEIIISDKDIIFIKNSTIFDVDYQNKNINISFNPKDIGQFLDTIIIESIGDCKTLDTIYIKGICKAEILAKLSNSEGYPGDKVNNTVNLELLQNIPLPKDFNYEIDIQINQDAISIIDATTFNYKNNKLEINIADYLNKTSYDGEVKNINSKILLAKNLENELLITNFTTDNPYLIPIRQNGNIKIYEVCLYEERLIQYYNEAIISNITQTNTKLSTYYAGKYTIEITDISGKTTTKELTTTSDNEEINLNYKLSNGTYIIKITEPGKIQTRKIIFVE